MCLFPWMKQFAADDAVVDTVDVTISDAVDDAAKCAVDDADSDAVTHYSDL